MLHCSKALVFSSATTPGGYHMVNKAKAGNRTNGTETFESAMKNGPEAFRTGFDKVVKGYEHFFGYGRETMEAYVTAATAAGRGVETLHNEIYAYSRQSVEDSISATKALFATRSVHEALELQTDFVKSAFDAYVGEMSKLSEIVFSTAKDTMGPLQGRVQAWVDVVENSRAA
jgi:phasin family protein